MKNNKVLNALVLISMVLSVVFSAKPVEAKKTADPSKQNYVPGEVVVVFKSGKSTSQYATMASALASKSGTKPVKVGAGGVALLRGSSTTDVEGIAAQLSADASVLYAEPNYIYSVPQDETASVGTNYLNEQFVVRQAVSETGPTQKLEAIPISFLQSLKTKVGNKIKATYPNDPYLWRNGGWSVINADYASATTTPSAGVCVLDTGADYLHPDLSGKIIKGYDFVNGDADPMDDNGHGTHVSGIITANANNGKGIAGASNAKVVAVKVLGAQGWGTNYDIAQGIYFCANRTDVKVLSMSLGGGSPSVAIHDAIDYAVNSKGKLLVAAAGNADTSDPSYPAYYANGSLYPEFTNKVLAVAASGSTVEETDGGYTYTYTDYGCRASYSNYGDWVSVVAPGTKIYSTTPYDKPFYLNLDDNGNVYPRYDYLSGTSMATPFVAAAVSRRWGYKPTETNIQVATDVVNSGWEVYTNGDDADGDGVCWPNSMDGVHQIDINQLLDRFAVTAQVVDASTGVGLTGATIQAYYNGVLKGSAVITPYTMSYNESFVNGILQQTDTFSYFSPSTTIINLPIPTNGYTFDDQENSGYVYKVNMSGYTASPQAVFQHSRVGWGTSYLYLENTASVPPKSTNFDVVMGFIQNYDYYNYDNESLNPALDLDLNVSLPTTPNGLDASQPANFIVGWEGDASGYLEGDSSGSMNLFPFARYKKEGGYMDSVPIEDLTISSRKAHAPLAANAALPYYPGTYVVAVTDFGETFDEDQNAATAEVPVMGAYAVPYVYIWKDGVIKLFNMMDYQGSGDTCNQRWWKAATITSGVSGVPTYTSFTDVCSNDEVPTTIFPGASTAATIDYK